MPDYKELYFQLFNEISNIIERLKEIQCEMEEKCISDEKDSIS